VSCRSCKGGWPKAAREVIEALSRAVQEFAQPGPQRDDLTAVVIKVEAPEQGRGTAGARRATESR